MLDKINKDHCQDPMNYYCNKKELFYAFEEEAKGLSQQHIDDNDASQDVSTNTSDDISSSSISYMDKMGNLDVIHASSTTNELVSLEFKKHTRGIGSQLLC